MNNGALFAIAVVAAAILYIALILYVLRLVLIGVIRLYRWFRPAPLPPKEIELEFGRGYLPDFGKREPFFGTNAKAWAVQMTFVVFCIVVLLPLSITYLKPHTDNVVNASFDAICAATGLCSPEAAERTHGSKLQQ